MNILDNGVQSVGLSVGKICICMYVCVYIYALYAHILDNGVQYFHVTGYIIHIHICISVISAIFYICRYTICVCICV